MRRCAAVVQWASMRVCEAWSRAGHYDIGEQHAANAMHRMCMAGLHQAKHGMRSDEVAWYNSATKYI
jgi:hypothetical protein